MKLSISRIIAISLLVLNPILFSTTPASAQIIDSTVVYRLFHDESSVWVEYFPGDTLADYSGIWKYEYILSGGPTNPGGIYYWHALFNDDGTSTDYSRVDISTPTGWYAYFVTEAETGNTSWWAEWDARASEGGGGTGYYVSPGTSLSGFDVVFDWNGDYLPGSQHYEAVDTGSESDDTIPVPEPTSMLLLGVGLIGLAGSRVKKRFTA